MSTLPSLVLIFSQIATGDTARAPVRAATTELIVTLRKRSFDLREFRDANLARVPHGIVTRIIADLERKAAADQADIARFVRSLGGKALEHFWICNSCVVSVPAAKRAELVAHPRVLRVEENRVIRPAIRTATDARNHNADAVQKAGFRGRGVTVAIVDSGCDSNMANTGRPHATFFVDGDVRNKGGGLGGSRLVVNKALGRMPADDVDGHGTAVAGIAIGGKWSSSPTSDHGHAPHASVAGYSIANDRNGNSDLRTIIRAWQTVASDAARLKIRTANNSYGGSPDPTSASQQALDSCARNADILIVVAAGNDPTSAASSQSCANGIAVGATLPNNRKIVFFSTRGPLPGDSLRYYPDMCANGAGILMPKADSERPGDDLNESGTSMAAPQVCGAATLYRAARTSADHLETKAALLATAEDVSMRNRRAPHNTRNSFGVGYLRDDLLIRVARRDAGVFVRSARLDAATRSQRYRYPVTGKRHYAVAIAWDRSDLTSAQWANLDLAVMSGTRTIATSASARNLYETIRFEAPATGTVDLVVTAKSLPTGAARFALVAAEIPPPFVMGSAVSYGAGCAGTGRQQAPVATAPSGFRTTFGGAADKLFSREQRLQTVFDAAALPRTPYVLSGVSLRHVMGTSHGLAGDIEISLDLGFTQRTPRSMAADFASNATGQMTRVVPRRRWNLPALRAANQDATLWAFQLPFAKPFRYVPGNRLLLDFAIHRASRRPYDALVDFTFNPPFPKVTSVMGPAANATRGFVVPGFGPILGFRASTANESTPRLTIAREPRIGESYVLFVSGAAARANTLLLVGASDSRWGALRLPFDFAALGAPKCSLLCSIESAAGVAASTNGEVRLTVAIPNAPLFVGSVLLHQALVIDKGANRLGIVSSNGVRARIGGQR